MRKRIVAAGALIVVVALFLYFVRPPGEPPLRAEGHEEASANETPLELSHGSLPGITWIDDIHPIFVRNKCGHCHTRGREAVVEGFEEFALGIIDPDDENNAYYSYHELVYAEGPPQIQEGETLRDGQCCWPRNYPEEKQRRIWLGHAERSVLVRKLGRNYYDWEKPPRFFEEAMSLRWGPPMPLYPKGKGGHGDHGPEGEGRKQYDIRPFYQRIFLNLSLWLGGGRDEFRILPERIPARDILLLGFWINNAVQLMENGTGIEVEVVNEKGVPAGDVEVVLVGNYNSADRKDVKDRMLLRTNNEGSVSVSFPGQSVVTSIWYAGAAKEGIITAYKSLVVSPGDVTRVSLQLK